MPTKLTATVDDGVLVLGGTPVRLSRMVTASVSSDSVRFEDNGAVVVPVPVKSDNSPIQVVDMSRLAVGVELFSEVGRVLGTQHSDRIWGYTSDRSFVLFGHGGDDRISGADKADRLYGGAGADSVYGGGGNDRIWGGQGSDSINASAGDDQIWGDQGNDTITGGEGTDTLIFTGARSEYTIDIVDGLYRISHVRGSKADGVDSFASVEKLQFTDQTILQDDWIG